MPELVPSTADEDAQMPMGAAVPKRNNRRKKQQSSWWTEESAGCRYFAVCTASQDINSAIAAHALHTPPLRVVGMDNAAAAWMR